MFYPICVAFFVLLTTGQTLAQIKDFVDPLDPTDSFFDDQQGEDWIDPFDMGLSPTAGSVRQKTPVKRATVQPSLSPEENIKFAVSSPSRGEGDMKEGKKAINKVEDMGETPLEESSNPLPEKCVNSSAQISNMDGVFLRRFANVLVKTLSLESITASIDTNVKVRMSSADVRAVREFAAGSRHPADFDAVTSTMMAYTFSDENGDSFLDKLTPDVDEDTAMRAAVAVCVVYWCYMYSQGQYWKMTTSAFFVSVAWTWCHMYKKAISDKMTRLAKEGAQVPKECSPDSMTWSESLSAAFLSRRDRCKEYHDAVLINPLIEVAPTMAVAQTLTTFVLLPLEHVGLALGKFFTALTSELTWFNSPFVLLFVFVTILLVTMMTFKYKIDLPFWIGSFGPAASAAAAGLAAATAEVRQLKNSCQELDAKCAALEERNLILTNNRTTDAVVQDILSIEQVPDDKTEKEEVNQAEALEALDMSLECSDSVENCEKQLVTDEKLLKLLSAVALTNCGDACPPATSETQIYNDDSTRHVLLDSTVEEVVKIFADIRAEREQKKSSSNLVPEKVAVEDQPGFEKISDDSDIVVSASSAKETAAADECLDANIDDRHLNSSKGSNTTASEGDDEEFSRRLAAAEAEAMMDTSNDIITTPSTNPP